MFWIVFRIATDNNLVDKGSERERDIENMNIGVGERGSTREHVYHITWRDREINVGEGNLTEYDYLF